MEISSCRYTSIDRLVIAATADGREYFVPTQSPSRALRLINEWVSGGGVIADPPTPITVDPPDRADIDVIDSQLRALVMVVANVTGTPMAEIRQKYRTAMNAILNQQGQ